MTRENDTDRSTEAAPSRARLGRWIGTALLVLVLIAGAVIGVRWAVWRLGHAVTEAAYVKADIADVAPQVAGRIVAIEVREGDTVAAGEVLFRIDPAEYDEQVAQAQAALDSARARAARAEEALAVARREVPAAIDAARAAVAAARTQLDKAAANRERWDRQYQRFEKLLAERAIGRAKFEQVETAWKAAIADETAARAQIELATARLKQAEAQRARIPQAEAAVREAQQVVKEAERRLRLAQIARARCDVRAPIAGRVARILVETGDLAVPGRPAVGLYDPATRYVEARFEETKLRFLEPGKRVELRVDSLPGRTLSGRVQTIAPASAAEFALIPRDVTAGEFTKVTQRVPIRIAIENLEDYPELVPGLSVEVAVAKRHG